MSNLAYEINDSDYDFLKNWTECVRLIDGSFMEKDEYEKLKNTDKAVMTIEDYAESFGFEKCVGDSFITYDELEEIKWHINKTHTVLDKTIIFNSINKDSRNQEGIKLKELDDYKIVKLVNRSFTDNYNVYMSQNTFLSTYKRTKKWVYRSEVMIIDIDYYKSEYKDLSPEEMYNVIKNKGFEGFEPSYTMFSGKGLYLVYLLEGIPLYNFNRNKALWENVASELVKKFEKYGADNQAKDICRVNRLPYSINMKTNKQSKILFYNDIKDKQLKKYSLSDLANNLLPKREEPQKKVINKKIKKSNKGKSRNVSNLYNYYTLAIARKDDLEKLLILRKFDIEGYRNTFFHLYSLVAFDIYKNHTEVKEFVYKLNNRLIRPLNNSEIDKIVNSSYRSYKIKAGEEKGYYNYYNKRIIELLNIQQDEMEKFKTLINKEEKNKRQKEKRKVDRRNGNGLTERQQNKQDIFNLVNNLLEEGYKQKDIAEKLELTKGRVSQIVKEIKALRK